MGYRQKLVKYIQRIVYWSGLAWLNHLVNPKNGALILMYHSVSSKDDLQWIDPANDIPAEVFESQICFIKKHCHVISMDTLIQSINNKEQLKPRTVVITFDDGYKNNFTVADKILKKYKLPATLYLATGYIERGEAQWIDELFTIFKHRSKHSLVIPETNIRFTNLSSINEEVSAYDFVRGILLTSNLKERRNLLNEIRAQLTPSISAPRLTISWKEIKEYLADNSSFSIGAHTRDHIDLTNINAEQAEAQIVNSINDIKVNLNIGVGHFSYPYGRCTQNLKDCAAQLNLKSAVATEPAAVIGAHSGVYDLARVEVPKSRTLFRFIVSGSYPELSIKLLGRS